MLSLQVVSAGPARIHTWSGLLLGSVPAPSSVLGLLLQISQLPPGTQALIWTLLSASSGRFLDESERGE